MQWEYLTAPELAAAIHGTETCILAMGVVVWIVRAIWPAPESAEHPEAR